jgi:protein TonB
MKTFLLSVFLLGGFVSLKPKQDLYDTCTKSYDVKLKRYVYEYSSLDGLPQFPGGMDKFYTYLHKGARAGNSQEIQSKVFYSFVVDIDGSVIGEEIPKKRVADYTPLEISGLETIRMLPKWIPGTCNKKKVPVRITIPMTICLSQ